jgi:hypothetical protein
MAKHPRFMGRPVYGLKGRNGDWNIRLVYCDVVPGPLGTPGDSHGIKRCPELIRESL